LVDLRGTSLSEDWKLIRMLRQNGMLHKIILSYWNPEDHSSHKFPHPCIELTKEEIETMSNVHAEHGQWLDERQTRFTEAQKLLESIINN